MIVQCADCKTSFRLNDELVPPRPIKVRCSRCGHVFAMDGRDVDRQDPAVQTASPAAAVSSPPRFGNLQLDGPAASPAQPSRPEPAAADPVVAPLAPPPAAGAPVAQKPASAPRPAAATEPASAPTQPGATPQTTPPAADLGLERSEPAILGGSRAPLADAGAATAVQTPPSTETFREVDLDAPPAPAETPAAATEDPQQKRQRDKARRLARALVSDILVYNREKRDKALASGNLVQALAGEIKKSWEVYKERVTPEVANSTDHFREALNDILAEGQKIF